MNDRPAARTGALLRSYLAASHLVAPLARRHLQKRLARGKEDPARWREKLGEASAPRPDGPLIWMHAVGVGEVLALPGLVVRLRARLPGAVVLLTSSSRTSAEAIAPNLPDGAIHQFLPLDAAPFIRAFLDHWRPDLSIWAERDIWPGLIAESYRRGIPLALVNGRMDLASFRAKWAARRLFRDLYRRFAFVGVQDLESAAHFAAFGIDPERLHLTGSLKSAAPPLADQPAVRAELESALQGRRVWIASSTHAGDEPAVAAAHAALLARDPGACLIVAPRDPSRAGAVCAALEQAGISARILPPDNQLPGPAAAYVVARIGQLGLWFRLADTAFVGGSIAAVGGHNPYEPARLDCAVLHGPNIANFAADYEAFHAAGAARLVRDGAELAAALQDPGLADLRRAAAGVAQAGVGAQEALADTLLSLMGHVPVAAGAGT